MTWEVKDTQALAIPSRGSAGQELGEKKAGGYEWACASQCMWGNMYVFVLEYSAVHKSQQSHLQMAERELETPRPGGC